MLLVAAAMLAVSFSKRSISRSNLWLRPAQFAYSRIMNSVGKCEATTVLATCGRSMVSVDMRASRTCWWPFATCLRGETAQRLEWLAVRWQQRPTEGYHAASHLARMANLRLSAKVRLRGSGKELC